MAEETSQERWLLLIHQIPPAPAYLRVKIGRRLQRLGAIAIKNSVYTLPSSEQAQEDLQWVLREIAESGGEGSICEARFVDGLTNAQVENLFNSARNTDYGAIVTDARAADGDINGVGQRLRRRLAGVIAIDFFDASGRQAAEAAVAAVERRAQALHGDPASTTAPRRHRIDVTGGRTWVTRRGVHVDRMASAWLIRRFIDAAARFKFVSGKGYVPESGELRFDMFEAEFTHTADGCTFEVLIDAFGLSDPALRCLAEIVHDIDLKDDKFGRQETQGIQHLIAGIAQAHAADDMRLNASATVWDGLYEYFRRKRS